ncbi:MAG TPA: proline dehydrogenase family protein [Pseudogracilibacillus sp.]|nr:proline dehydrogenase family protein [Pseudogracilibacillus sp.]
MSNLTRHLFVALSNNNFLNRSAQKWGFRFGAEQFVAGTNVETVLKSVKRLNDKGMSATVDNLGEFVTERHISLEAKERIIHLIKEIDRQSLDCHLSIKLTQLGLDIDKSFCFENVNEIASVAQAHNVFINIDTEDYAHLEETIDILEQLLQTYDNVGTVIQAYLYRAEEIMDRLQNTRLRIVKGAYNEDESIAYQDKADIDANFIHLIKKRLKGHAFTSIATHDHHVINEVKQFVHDEEIDLNSFEFQMLYGFRTDMQKQLAKDGYHFCTYIPFGEDWYGYFMRRLAERPQNLNLIIKDKFYTKDDKLKKGPIIATSLIAASALYFVCKKRK